MTARDYMLTSPPGLRVEPEWTVNETLRIFPATVAVFNEFGIDACCGGATTIAAAAQRDGVSLVELVEALRLTAEGAR